MGLLSSQDFLDIRDAIKDVTDTFFVTPITYKRKVADVSRFGEGEGKTFEDYALLGMYEQPESGSLSTRLTPGGLSKEDTSTVQYDCKVTIHFSDIDAQLKANNEFLGVIGEDRFIAHNITFVCIDSALAGPLEDAQILLYLYGKKL